MMGKREGKLILKNWIRFLRQYGMSKKMSIDDTIYMLVISVIDSFIHKDEEALNIQLQQLKDAVQAMNLDGFKLVVRGENTWG